MDLSLTEDQQAIVDAFARFLERECTTERVRASEPLGFDADLWKQLCDLGLPSLAVSLQRGGGGFGLLDVALAVEVAGARLVPAPFVEAVAAGRLLDRVGIEATAGLTTLALHPADAGRAPLVPGGAVADSVVALDGDDLVVASLGPGVRPAPANLGSSPLSDVDLAAGGRRVVATGTAAVALHTQAVDEWRVLTAAALAGLAAEALRIGVDYVKERRQFGAPIGSFQAVQHRLADVAAAVDGARLVARQAAWAIDASRVDCPVLASTAFLHCSRTADDAAAASLHFHGGYGFMLEYDIQLYLRRARAWHLVLGDLADEEQVLADRLYGPAEAAGT